MKKYIFLLMFGLIAMWPLKAQFVVTAIPPPPTFAYEDLWHLMVTGMDSNYVAFYLSLRIYNEQGILEVKSNSNVFGFQHIPLYVNKTNLGPLPAFSTLYYNSTMLQAVITSGGFFPVGTYNIEFLLYGRPTDGAFSEIGEYTYQVIVEAFWPPMLLTPLDEDTIDTPYPLLTWTPAFFATGGNTIYYDLTLVEMNPNQTPYMAISSNPTHYGETGLPGTVKLYPVSANSIELGKHYAWQVAATINGQPVAYSQIWSFVYWVDEVEVEKESGKIFFQLKRVGEHKGVDYLFPVDDYIRFQLDQDYVLPSQSAIGFVIKNKNNETVYSSANSQDFPLAYGRNRFVLDPCALNLDPTEPYYKLVVNSNKNQGYYMYFKLHPELNCN